jgi:hypothetical protein
MQRREPAADELESLDLAHGFGELAAHGRREDLHGLDHPVGIDDIAISLNS